MCNSAKRVLVCACKGAWQVGRVSLPNQLLKRLCRNAQVFLFHWKQSHTPSGQVRLEPPESSGSLRRYFTRHDNTRHRTALPATDKIFWNNVTLFTAEYSAAVIMARPDADKGFYKGALAT